jgi:hypothetical protein
VTNEHSHLMQSLVQEVNGLYEPHAWADVWKNSPQTRFESAMGKMADQFRAKMSSQQNEQQESDSNDSDWDTD